MVANPTITDPSVAFIGPRAAIQGQPPFTFGQAFAVNQGREQNIEKFLQAIGGNNQLRAVLAQRLAAQEAATQRHTNITGNLEGLVDVFGRKPVAGMLGMQGTEFGAAQDALQLGRGQAGVAETLGQATNEFRQGGILPRFQDPLTQVAGLASMQDVTPTSVAAKVAEASGVDVTFPIPGTGAEGKATVSRDTGGLVGEGLRRIGVGAKSELAGQALPLADSPFKGVDVAPESLEGVTDAQIRRANETVEQVRGMDVYRGREVEVRNGPNGSIVVLVRPNTVIQVIDQQGRTVN